MNSRVLALLVAALTALAVQPAAAQCTTGVILMHGKGGDFSHSAGLRDISGTLESAGCKTALPSWLPWSRGAWDNVHMTMQQVFEQLDQEAAKLRAKGATRIVIGGQSLGANVALSYAVERGNLAGVFLLAPGHQPGHFYQKDKSIHEAVDKARALKKAGKGSDSFRGPDENQGATLTLSTTVDVYLSWMSPGGPANMIRRAPMLPATTPIFVAVARDDPFFANAERLVYKPAAKNPYSKYVVVGGGHMTTDMAASKQTSDWIKGLP